MRHLWALLAIASPVACSFDSGFDGTAYRCDDEGRCPSGTSCVEGVCRAAGDEPDPDAMVNPPDAQLSEWASCAELREAGEGDSGAYFVDPDGVGGEPAFEVYCDMVMDGGGWTMVARSVPDVEEAFGWLTETGDVRVLEGPYSLGVDRPGFTFSSLLVGAQGAGYAWGGQVYRIDDLPGGFPMGYEDEAANVDPVTVVGACDPAGGPGMLQRLGFSDRFDLFFFRDVGSESPQYGLRPDGWSTYYNDCGNGGGLDDLQGMIFVR